MFEEMWKSFLSHNSCITVKNIKTYAKIALLFQYYNYQLNITRIVSFEKASEKRKND